MSDLERKAGLGAPIRWRRFEWDVFTTPKVSGSGTFDSIAVAPPDLEVGVTPGKTYRVEVAAAWLIPMTPIIPDPTNASSPNTQATVCGGCPKSVSHSPMNIGFCFKR